MCRVLTILATFVEKFNNVGCYGVCSYGKIQAVRIAAANQVGIVAGLRLDPDVGRFRVVHESLPGGTGRRLRSGYRAPCAVPVDTGGYVRPDVRYSAAADRTESVRADVRCENGYRRAADPGADEYDDLFHRRESGDDVRRQNGFEQRPVPGLHLRRRVGSVPDWA